MKSSKYLFLIVGVGLGVIPAIINKLPDTVAVWSGLRLFSGHVAYLWGALVIAYINSRSWVRSFVTSSLTVLIATAVYYSIISLFGLFGIGFTEGFLNIAKDWARWSCVGVACGGLSATVMFFAVHCKLWQMRFQALAASYLGVMAVIYFYYIRVLARSYNESMAIASEYVSSGNFAGDIFEVVLAVGITTALFAVAIKTLMSGRGFYAVSWCVRDTFTSTMGGVLFFTDTGITFNRTSKMQNPVTFDVPYSEIVSIDDSRSAVIVNMADGKHYKFIVYRRQKFMRDITARMGVNPKSYGQGLE